MHDVSTCEVERGHQCVAKSHAPGVKDKEGRSFAEGMGVAAMCGRVGIADATTNRSHSKLNRGVGGGVFPCLVCR